MASDDLQVMEQMLTTVEQQIKTSLRQIGQPQQGLDPKFKQIFLQAINTRAAAAYSGVEVEFQLKVLQLSRSGIANCQVGSSQMDIGAAGQVRGHASCFKARRSNDIQTILQIMDSSDDEDVKPVVIKTEAETSVDRTDRQENNQKESPIVTNQMNKSSASSTTTNRLMQSERSPINNSTVKSSHQKSSNPIDPHFKSGADVGSTTIAKKLKGKPCGQAEASTSVGSVKADEARNKQKRHKCEFCGYVANQKCSLVNHIRTHTGERPHQCGRCLKKFSQSSSLKRHQLVHVKCYKFRCVGCIRVFKDEKDKIAHDRECKKRRYECHLCKKYATVRKSGLLMHMRKHSGVKPFQCLICMKWYQQKINLKKHLNTIHGTKN